MVLRYIKLDAKAKSLNGGSHKFHNSNTTK